jgi:hypothetical protein
MDEPMTAARFVEALQQYFGAERQVGWAMVGVGVGLLGAAAWAMRTQAGAFGWWLVGSFALLGLVFGVGGAALAVRSAGQLEAFTAQHASEPAGLVAQETPRMAKVNANWPKLKVAWTVIIVVALVLLQLQRKEWAVALGLVLLFVATLLFFTDVFAERRAELYTRALEREAARITQGSGEGG